MNKRLKGRVGYLILLFFIPIVSNGTPFLWNVDRLNTFGEDSQHFKLYSQIISKADKYCGQSLFRITEKQQTYAPNKHYYCSIAPYWWPNDMNIDGVYKRKDGSINPERQKYDYPKLVNLTSRLKYLSIAFYLTRDEKYYNSYLLLIGCWFINNDTYMYPSFEYAQVINGLNNNKGNVQGIAETEFLIDIIESFLLINEVRPFKEDVIMPIKMWFKDFMNWMTTDDVANNVKSFKNNITTLYELVLLEIAMFVGDRDYSLIVISDFQKELLPSQIADDGSMPAELSRVNAFGYSVRNMKEIVEFCIIADKLQKVFFGKNRCIIQKAIDFLCKYSSKLNGTSAVHINSMDTSITSLDIQIQRLSRVSYGRKLSNKCKRKTVDMFENIDYILM